MFLLPLVKSKAEETTYVDFFYPKLSEGFYLPIYPQTETIRKTSIMNLVESLSSTEYQEVGRPPYNIQVWKNILQNTIHKEMNNYIAEHPFTKHKLTNITLRGYKA